MKELSLPCQKELSVKKIKVVTVRQEQVADEVFINSPEAVYRLSFLRDELLSSDREIFVAVHLNTKNKLLSYEVISIGSLSSSIVHPRELFKAAILVNAASIILCHNHPSGDPAPSREDIKLTEKLANAGKILGIDVLDHVIFGDHFVSLKEKGIL